MPVITLQIKSGIMTDFDFPGNNIERLINYLALS